MIINSSESNLNFDDFWCELPSILGPGKIVGRYYGRPIIIKRIKISYVSVDSPDSGGEIDIPVEYFKEVCGDWRSYKYEKLSGDNPKSTLDVISIVSYVIQTWVRRSERDKLIEKACCAGIPDGAFWIVDYNHYSRLIGPNPAGEIISLGDVFPDEDREDLAEVELMALSLHKSANELSLRSRGKNFVPRQWLRDRFPQFSQEVYDSVVWRAFCMDIR